MKTTIIVLVAICLSGCILCDALTLVRPPPSRRLGNIHHDRSCLPQPFILPTTTTTSSSSASIVGASRFRTRHCMSENYMNEGEDEDEEPRLSDEELEAASGEWDEKVARFNTVHLTGRIGNDPEPKYLDDGKVVVNLSLATRRKYHGLERKVKGIQSGEEETDWYYLEIWGQKAEFVSKYVDKGARVGVIGSLQIDDWTDKATGEPRSSVKVVVREFDILETRDEANLRRGNRQRNASYGDRQQQQRRQDDDDWSTSPAGSGNFF